MILKYEVTAVSDRIYPVEGERNANGDREPTIARVNVSYHHELLCTANGDVHIVSPVIVELPDVHR